MYRVRWMLSVACGLFLVLRFCTTTLAEGEPAEGAPTVLAVPEAIDVASLTSARIAATRDDLRHATGQLSHYLSAGAGEAEWKAYLRWQILDSQLASDAAPDIAMLRAVYARFAARQAGLDLPPFADVRQSLAAYVEALETDRLANVPLADLPMSIRALRTEFRPINAVDVERKLARVRETATRLTEFLDGGGKTGSQWKEAVGWRDLEEQLRRAVPERAVLVDTHARLAADYQGLELPVFRDARHALRVYLQSARDAEDSQAKQAFEQRLQSLAIAVESYLKHTRDVATSEIGLHLGWLEERDQVAPLVAAIRARFSQATLSVFISQRLIDASARRTIDESVPLNATVQGIAVNGTAQVVGQISAQLLPDEQRGRLQVRFEGDMKAEIKGNRGPITVCASADATIAVGEDVFLDAVGASDSPPQANVQSTLHVTGVGTTLRRPLDRLARRVTWRIAAKKEGAAGDSAGEQAKLVLEQRMKAEVDAILDKFNTQYLEQWRNPLLRHDQFPRKMTVRTTQEAMAIGILQASPFQLGAASPPPPCKDPADITVYLHESFVNNYAAGMLAGKTLSDHELRRQMGSLSGAAGVAGKPVEDEVTLTLADVDPITLRMEDEVVKITIRGERFVVRNNVYPPMNISLAFNFERDGSNYRLKLAAEPDIVPPRFVTGAERRYSARELAMRRILLNRLDREFKEGLDVSRLALPSAAGDSRELHLGSAAVADGWLVISAHL